MLLRQTTMRCQLKSIISCTRVKESGLDGRPWYKHHIYAPGFYTGYGVKTIPGVREAIEQREYDKVGPQIEIAADVLNGMADRIATLTGMLRGK